MILALLSQKGGVGKSTLARLVAVEMIKAGWAVKVGDLDPAQGTSTKWGIRRDAAEVDPVVPVQKYRDAKRAMAEADQWDLLILDGPAHADRSGMTMATGADLIILPTSYSLDDMEPQAEVAYSLEAAGVDPDRIRMAFCRARGSQTVDAQARNYVRRAGLKSLGGAIREMPSVAAAHADGRTAAETGRPTVDREAQALGLEIANLLLNPTKG